MTSVSIGSPGLLLQLDVRMRYTTALREYNATQIVLR